MEAILARWRGLDGRGRSIVAALAFAALCAVTIAFAIQRDTRVALFAVPLRAEQIEEVAERLAEWNAPFVVTADNVRVDGGRRNDLLLKLAMLGVPHAHLASLDDALAKAGPLTPQSILDAQALDGRAGDLASGLRGVAGVDDARVVIAAPRGDAFADEAGDHQTTASVRLSLRAGATLARATVAGIRAYVAAGVPGLAPERVAILDDRGGVLDDAPAPADDAAALQSSLQTALDEVFGAGATIVRVRETLDPRSSRRRDLVRRALSGMLGSNTSDEHYKSASKAYAKSNATVEHGSETHDENVDVPAGRVERMSVAVAVDAARDLDLAKIRSFAAATLGLQPARGDIVSVESVAFAQPPHAPHGWPFLAAFGTFAGVLPSAFFALAVLLAARYLAKPLGNACVALIERLAIARTSRAVTGYAPAHVRGALVNEPPHTAAAIISALPAATATAVLEMYPPEERAAIVRRMSRASAPAVPDHETVLRRA